MFFPKFLEQNECIGICAPSKGVGHKIESFDKSIKTFEKEGYKIKETESVRNLGERSNSAVVRAKEFQTLIEDTSINMIIAASGGDYNYEILPYIDDDTILYHPKWIMGASDPTFITYYITTKLDIATLYGKNAGSFDQENLHESLNNTLSILKGNLIEQKSFKVYEGTKNFESGEYILDTPVYWTLYNSKKLDVSGRLIGGCLDVIANIIGTKFDYTKEFLERYNEVIWYFDVFEMSAERLYLSMLQMNYCGYFNNTKAIIFGRVLFKNGSKDIEYIENLKECFDIPFVFNADIGHTSPSMTLINGSLTRVKCFEGKGSIYMECI